jgi:hypothetical protein
MSLFETRKRAIKSAPATLDFPSVAAGADEELTVTVPDAAIGDPVVVAPPAALEAGLAVTAFVSAANTVTVRLVNATVAPIDPASASYTVAIIK